MTDKINVRPTKPSAIGLKHPDGAPLAKEGTIWPYDGFTCRLLTEKSIERVPDEKPAPAAAPAQAPAPKAA
jgi:hypothetical protein